MAVLGGVSTQSCCYFPYPTSVCGIWLPSGMALCRLPGAAGTFYSHVHLFFAAELPLPLPHLYTSR